MQPVFNHRPQFNFERECHNLMYELRAKPVSADDHDYEMSTRAGPMELTPTRMGLICRFTNRPLLVGAALPGLLNVRTGFWVWVFSLPDQDDLEFLKGVLQEVFVTDAT